MEKTIEIPEGYEARIEGNKVIFERKESEDEKIRKFIAETIFYCYGDSQEYLDVLAYLERQKEQRPVHTAKEMWKEMRLEVYAQASGNRHEPNYSDDSTKMFSLCDIDEIFEKIGNSTVESQPTEWSEEDNAKKERLISIVKRALHENKCPILNDDGATELITWLKSLRPSWKPNEEQMEALFLVSGVGAPKHRETLKSLYNDLKNL